jgi:hypothetical protein
MFKFHEVPSVASRGQKIDRLDYRRFLEDHDFTNIGYILKGSPANFDDTL